MTTIDPRLSDPIFRWLSGDEAAYADFYAPHAPPPPVPDTPEQRRARLLMERRHARAALRKIDAAYAPVADAARLPVHAVIALLTLDKEGAMRIGELARRCEIDPMHFTPVADALEAGGWITRERDPHSRRATRVGITPDGARRLDALRDAIAACEAALDAALHGGAV